MEVRIVVRNENVSALLQRFKDRHENMRMIERQATAGNPINWVPCQHCVWYMICSPYYPYDLLGQNSSNGHAADIVSSGVW